MMKTVTASILGAAILASPLTAATWSLDKAHSSVGFKVSHMVISKVSGQFDDYDGSLTWDGKDLSTASVEVTVNVASINTDNERRDNHLKSSDFFAADSFPTMTFKSKKIIPGMKNKFQIVGDLTLRGVTKEITLDAQLNGVIKDPMGNTRAGFSATGEINRQDFGVSWSHTLDSGGLVAGDDVEIDIQLEAIMSK